MKALDIQVDEIFWQYEYDKKKNLFDRRHYQLQPTSYIDYYECLKSSLILHLNAKQGK